MSVMAFCLLLVIRILLLGSKSILTISPFFAIFTNLRAEGNELIP